MIKISPFIPALLLLTGALIAADEPALKEGFWSIHSLTTQRPGGNKAESSRSICRSREYDAHVRSLPKNTSCKTVNETSSGNARTTETECEINGTIMKSTGTLTTTGDSATHSETHTTYTPPMFGMAEATAIMDQKYIGPCPAGIDPGDIVGANGKVTHTWNKQTP